MNIVIVLSGGTGSRLGADIPKQYIRTGEHMMITDTLVAVSKCKDVDAIRIVCAPEWEQSIEEDLADFPEVNEKIKGFSAPGANRQLSAINAMRDIMVNGSPEDIVVLHDAARPLVKASTISDIIAACADHDGAMPVLPMKDTVYISEDGKRVSSLIDRKTVFAGQAPEAFRLGKYLEANEALIPDRIMSINGATEPAILAGLDIAMIPGDEGNFKITTEGDMDRYMQLFRNMQS